MFVNNFVTKLIAPLEAGNAASLPVSGESMAVAHGLRLTITESLDFNNTDVEIIEVRDGIVARGLENTAVKSWPTGSYVFCAITAEYANKLNTPALTSEAEIVMLPGVGIAEPINVQGQGFSNAEILRKIIVFPTEYEIQESAEASKYTSINMSMDNGRTWYVPFVTARNELFNAVFFSGSGSKNLFVFVVTRDLEKNTLIFYGHDVRAKKITRTTMNAGAGLAIAKNHLIQGSSYIPSDSFDLFDGDQAYRFSCDRVVDGDASVFTGGITLTGTRSYINAMIAPGTAFPDLRGAAGDVYFVDINGAGWRGGPAWDNDDLYEFERPWFVPESMQVAFLVSPDSSSSYAISTSGVIDSQYGSIDLDLGAETVVGAAWYNRRLHIGTSSSEVIVVEVIAGPSPFVIDNRFYVDSVPYQLLANDRGYYYNSSDTRSGGKGDLMRDGKEIYQDGYMPGSLLEDIMRRLSVLESAS